jgi:hypothetical protein
VARHRISALLLDTGGPNGWRRSKRRRREVRRVLTIQLSCCRYSAWAVMPPCMRVLIGPEESNQVSSLSFSPDGWDRSHPRAPYEPPGVLEKRIKRCLLPNGSGCAEGLHSFRISVTLGSCDETTHNALEIGARLPAQGRRARCVGRIWSSKEMAEGAGAHCWQALWHDREYWPCCSTTMAQPAACNGTGGSLKIVIRARGA